MLSISRVVHRGRHSLLSTGRQGGSFKAWVEANTEVSYRTAAAYMKVANEAAKGAELCTFQSIDAFLKATRQSEKPKAKATNPKPSDSPCVSKLDRSD